MPSTTPPRLSRLSRLLCAGLLLALGTSAFAADEPDKRLITSQALSDLIIYPEHSAPASVVSVNDSRLSAQISAPITHFAVQVGDTVEKGATLVSLDCRDYQLARQRAVSRWTLTKQQLGRASVLRKKNNISQEALDQRKNEYEDADFARKQAVLNEQRCVISAPFDGIVLERLAGEGELASPGTVLLRLLDRSRIEVSAQVPVDQVGQLSGARALYFATNHQRWPLALRVSTPAINTQARNREVRLHFSQDQAMPGAAGRLLWQSAQAHLPAEMLTQRDEHLGVFVLKDGHARFEILPDALEGRPARVDLPLDSAIIVQGRQALNDGDSVSRTKEDAVVTKDGLATPHDGS